jgi:predicted Zn-dependent protease
MPSGALSRRQRAEHEGHDVSAGGLDVCDRILTVTAGSGADALVLVRESNSGHVRFAANDITTSGEVSEAIVRLMLAFGSRHATTQTNQVDDASLRELVARTTALAKVAPRDPEYLGPLAARRYETSSSDWDEATASPSPGVRASAAQAAIAAAADGFRSAGFVQTHADAFTLAASTGLRAEHKRTWAQMTTTMRTPDDTGSGWAGAEAVRVTDIDGGALGRVARDKAERSRLPANLPPGRYTVVLEPAAVADLLSFLIEQLDARAADQGRSLFSRIGGGNRIGELIFDRRVVLRSMEASRETPARTWDDEGVPLRDTTWIADGKLVALRYTRFWAHQAARDPSGTRYSYHLSSPSGETTAASLVKGVQRGLLVTRFWYTRWLDPKELLVTGLTRDGVWLIEDGRVTSAVKNFRFNDSPMKMLTHLVGMTASTFRVPAGGDVMRVPVVCCSDFEMASVSDAV